MTALGSRVAVLVPYRGDGGPRDEAWTYVRRWWTTSHPQWPVLTGACPVGAWSKGAAVADALHYATWADVIIVADADVTCPDVTSAVAAVTTGAARWAIPHHRVQRLSPQATADVVAGAAPQDTGRPAESYKGMGGGGLVVLPAALYATVPLDPRFEGWGQEDASWGHALTVVAGQPWRGTAPLWHLWHPPQVRATRRLGNPAGVALYRRYRSAYTPTAILAILAEVSPSPC